MATSRSFARQILPYFFLVKPPIVDDKVALTPTQMLVETLMMLEEMGEDVGRVNEYQRCQAKGMSEEESALTRRRACAAARHVHVRGFRVHSQF